MDTKATFRVHSDHVVLVAYPDFNIEGVQSDIHHLFDLLEANDLSKVVFDNRQLLAEMRAVEKSLFAGLIMDEANLRPDFMKQRILKMATLVPATRMPLFKAFKEMIQRVSVDIQTETFNDPAELYEWLGAEPVDL